MIDILHTDFFFVAVELIFRAPYVLAPKLHIVSYFAAKFLFARVLSLHSGLVRGHAVESANVQLDTMCFLISP